MSSLHRFLVHQQGLAAAVYREDGTATVWVWVRDSNGRYGIERHDLATIAQARVALGY